LPFENPILIPDNDNDDGDDGNVLEAYSGE
jgi:hypothetical protein